MKKLWKDEDGLTTVEYALLLALVVVAGITAWSTLGSTVADKTGVVEQKIDAAAVPTGEGTGGG